MTTIKEWLTKNKGNYTDRRQCLDDCAKELKVRRDSVLEQSRFIWPAKEPMNLDATDTVKDIITPADFIAEIDIVAKVLGFLDENVKEGYIENEKLRKRFGVSHTKWKELIRLPIFKDRSITYDCGNARKQTVWSSQRGIEIVRSTVSMARYDT